jgi:hypothetical protein
MTACCVCWTQQGLYRRADPRVEGLRLCPVCSLEALWQSRTQPSVSPLFNPAAASDLQRYLFASAAR